MADLPQYQPQTANAPISTPQALPHPVSGDAQVGQALENLGSAGENVAMDAYTRAVHGQAGDGILKAQFAINNILGAQEGLEGRQALNNDSNARNQINGAMSDVRDTMTPAARQVFDQEMRRVMEDTNKRLETHFGEQTFVANAATAKGMVISAQQAAAAKPEDTQGNADRLTMVDKFIRNTLPNAEEMIPAFHTAVHDGVLEALMAGDDPKIDKAKAYYYGVAKNDMESKPSLAWEDRLQGALYDRQSLADTRATVAQAYQKDTGTFDVGKLNELRAKAKTAKQLDHYNDLIREQTHEFQQNIDETVSSVGLPIHAKLEKDYTYWYRGGQAEAYSKLVKSGELGAEGQKEYDTQKAFVDRMAEHAKQMAVQETVGQLAKYGQIMNGMITPAGQALIKKMPFDEFNSMLLGPGRGLANQEEKNLVFKKMSGLPVHQSRYDALVGMYWKINGKQDKATLPAYVAPLIAAAANDRYGDANKVPRSEDQAMHIAQVEETFTREAQNDTELATDAAAARKRIDTLFTMGTQPKLGGLYNGDSGQTYAEALKLGDSYTRTFDFAELHQGKYRNPAKDALIQSGFSPTDANIDSAVREFFGMKHDPLGPATAPQPNFTLKDDGPASYGVTPFAPEIYGMSPGVEPGQGTQPSDEQNVESASAVAATAALYGTMASMRGARREEERVTVAKAYHSQRAQLAALIRKDNPGWSEAQVEEEIVSRGL